MKTLLFLVYFLFLFYSFEAFWNFIGIKYNGVIAFLLAIPILFVFVSPSTRIKKKIDSDLLVLVALLFAPLLYYFGLSLVWGVKWGLLFFYEVAVQLTLSCFVCLVFLSNSKPIAGRLYRDAKGKFLLLFFVAGLPELILLINYANGGAQSVFNQNWVMIGSVSLALFSFSSFIVSGGAWTRRWNCLLFIAISLVALHLKSLGVAVSALLLGLVFLLDCASLRTALTSLVTPLAAMIVLVFFVEYDLFQINSLIARGIGTDVSVDYSSGRFGSWDLVINDFRTNLLSFIFGHGIDVPTNVYFTSVGTTASSHNFFLETVFRVGVAGALMNLLPFVVMLFIINRHRGLHAKLFNVIFISFMMLSMFYDIGGFTHLVGTFFYKMLLSFVFVSYLRDIKQRVLVGVVRS